MEILAELPPPCMGVDKSYKDKDDAKGHGGLRSPWFQELIDHSNYSFLSIYLTHPPILPYTEKDYTDTSCHVSNQWTRSWDTLLKQGWGGWFIYAGYTGRDTTNNVRPRPFTEEVAKNAGIRHAQHIKTTISEFKVDNSGSVVFMDNEGGILAQEANLKIYYNTLFSELRKAGPGTCQPARPGIYCHENQDAGNATELLVDNPDLFIWQIQDHGEARHRGGSRKDATMLPIPLESKDGLYLDPTDFGIRTSQRVKSNQNIVNIPLGIQGLLNYGEDTWYELMMKKNPDYPKEKEMSFPPMPTRLLGRLTPVLGWDLDMSFVRDPRYPEASPRIRTLNGAFVQGQYFKAERRMKVAIAHGRNPVSLEGPAIEPEAPLLLPNEDTLITIGISGDLVSAARSKSRDWSALTVMKPLSKDRALRRLRGITAITIPDDSTFIFYITRNLTIQVLRQPNPQAQWDGPTDLFESSDIKLSGVHGFSNISCVFRRTKMPTIAIFLSTTGGKIIEVTYSPAPSSNATTVLNTKILRSLEPPYLLFGSSLLAASSDPTSNVILGVSRTLRLMLFQFSASSGWDQTPVILGADTTSKVFAHTRLAVSFVNPIILLVGAISYQGYPIVFTLSFDLESKRWGMASGDLVGDNPKFLPRLRMKPPNLGQLMPLKKGELDARQWSINPWGDVNFGIDPSGTGQTVLVCAGTGPQNEVRALYRRIGLVNEDWYLVE